MRIHYAINQYPISDNMHPTYKQYITNIQDIHPIYTQYITNISSIYCKYGPTMDHCNQNLFLLYKQYAVSMHPPYSSFRFNVQYNQYTFIMQATYIQYT